MLTDRLDIRPGTVDHPDPELAAGGRVEPLGPGRPDGDEPEPAAGEEREHGARDGEDGGDCDCGGG